MAEDLVIGFFGVWFLLSLLVLFPKLSPRIRTWDWFALVPEWKFFAPVPGQWDFHILYRDRLHDESLTEWTEVPVGEERGWWNVVWNPSKRGRKALFDAILELGGHVKSHDRALEGSVPYLTLLNHISSLPRSPASELTQFVLLRFHARFSAEEPEVVFASSLHAL